MALGPRFRPNRLVSQTRADMSATLLTHTELDVTNTRMVLGYFVTSFTAIQTTDCDFIGEKWIAGVQPRQKGDLSIDQDRKRQWWLEDLEYFMEEDDERSTSMASSELLRQTKKYPVLKFLHGHYAAPEATRLLLCTAKDTAVLWSS